MLSPINLLKSELVHSLNSLLAITDSVKQASDHFNNEGICVLDSFVQDDLLDKIALEYMKRLHSFEWHLALSENKPLAAERVANWIVGVPQEIAVALNLGKAAN